MNRILGILLVSSAIAWSFQANPRQRKSFWLSAYPQIPQSDPLRQRAQQVFAKVQRVAQRRPERPPELVLVDKPMDPWAMALEDGGIVLTRSALDICYKDVPGRVGDAFLAFVLAHEMAHLSVQDFLHLSFAPSDSGDSFPATVSESQLFSKEVNADHQGVIWVTLAGYDPWLLLGSDESFFERWAAQSVSRYALKSHPSPKERAAVIRQALVKLESLLPLFQVGVRFYEARQFERAIEFINGFRPTFAGPSVLNLLALSHYQLGYRSLAECDGEAATRYYLPTLVDPRSVANRGVRRGPASNCLSDPHLEKAQELFEQIHSGTTDYQPALLNYASLLMLTRYYQKAFGVVADLRPGMESRMFTLLAFHELGKAADYDTSQDTLVHFKELHDEFPHSPWLTYNYAAVLEESEGRGAAIRMWKEFLQLEPSGEFADRVRQRIGEPQAVPANETRTTEAVPPVPLGEVTEGTRRWLEAIDPSPVRLTLGNWSGRFYENASYRALTEIRREGAKLVMVEEKSPQPGLDTPAARQADWRTVTTTGEFLLFGHWGIERSEGAVTARVFFDRDSKAQ